MTTRCCHNVAGVTWRHYAIICGRTWLHSAGTSCRHEKFQRHACLFVRLYTNERQRACELGWQPAPYEPCCEFRNKNRFRFNPYISDSFRSIMHECEICFRCTDSFVVEVRITPSDYHSFFFSPNWYLKFIPNDFAPIRTKFSFRLNPFNSAKSFRMISRHSPFSPNDSVPLHAQSEWFRRAFKRTGFRMIRKQISHSYGIISIPNQTETCIREARD